MRQDTDRPLERRRHPRTRLQMSLQCVRLDPDGGDALDRLRMIDISRAGMGAHCDRPFYPGQRLMLCLPLSSSSGRRNVYATIVRCHQSDEGHRVGLSFDNSSVGSAYGTGGTVAA